MKTTLTTIFLFGLSTAFSQYNQDFDTSWTSLLQNSICSSVKFDEENNYYNSYIQYTTSYTEAGAILKLQKRNANNQILWEKQNGLRILGFDYNNNLLCGKGFYNNSGVGLYSTDGYIFRLNASNGNFIDSIAINGGLSIQKYQGDYLIYNGRLARYSSNFQLLWDSDIPNPTGYEPLPIEELSFIRNDTLFYGALSSSNNTGGVSFIKLSTGFTGSFQQYDDNDLLRKSVINCNGICLGMGNAYTGVQGSGVIKIGGSYNWSLLINGFTYGTILNVENQDEFIVLGYDPNNNQLKIARCNILGNTLSNDYLPTGFTLADMYIQKKPIFYSNGYTYIFGKKNNHLCILIYDVALNLVNEFNDNADPMSYTKWYDFDANSSGCFAVVGSEFYGTKENATLVKYCSADASIDEEKIATFSLHPNPTSSQLFLTLTNPSYSDMLTVFSLTGQKILERKVETSSNSFQIEVEDFNPGVYFIQIGEHTEKFIVE